MNQIAPAGPIYQAGTLSGNPIAVTSGLATLSILQRDPTVFKQVEDTTIAICEGFERLAAQYNVSVVVQRVGSMFTIFFIDKPVKNFDDAASCNEEQFKNVLPIITLSMVSTMRQVLMKVTLYLSAIRAVKWNVH